LQRPYRDAHHSQPVEHGKLAPSGETQNALPARALRSAVEPARVSERRAARYAGRRNDV